MGEPKESAGRVRVWCTGALALILVSCSSPDSAQTLSNGDCSDVASMDVPAVGGGLEAGPHTFVADGVRFWYCVGGVAAAVRSPVVFLHGGPGQGSQHFAALTGPTLHPDLRIVYFDQRGSGRSERPWNQEYALPVLVDDIERLRAVLGVERISLLGHSFGGLLALEYAARYPEQVEKLVVVSGLSDVPGTAKSVCERIASLDSAAYSRAMQTPLPGGFCNPFAAYSGSDRQAFDRAAMFPDTMVEMLLTEADRLDGLRNTGEVSRAMFNEPGAFTRRFTGHDRLRMPVLVVAGDQDHQIGLEPQRSLAQQIPSAELVVLQGAGHFPHLDQPAGFADALIQFLSRGP